MKIYMNISALNMSEAELMLKVLDHWFRTCYNVYGVQRNTSFSRRGNAGRRAQIRVKIEKTHWDKIKGGVMTDCVRRLGKSVSTDWIVFPDGFQVIEFSTEEASI